MKKDFDCVEMKRAIQAEIYEEIKDLSDPERTAYFRRHAETGPFAAKLREIDALASERAEAARKLRAG